MTYSIRVIASSLFVYLLLGSYLLFGQAKKPFTPAYVGDHECPPFSHYHVSVKEFMELFDKGQLDARTFMPQDAEREAELDGTCHDDVDDKPLSGSQPRTRLPKPYRPNQKDGWL